MRLRRLQSHVTYANVTATLALFIAIGGSSYAALRVDSRDIVNNSVRSGDLRNNHVRSRDVRDRTLIGRDVRRNTLKGEQIRESGLAPVPMALNAERLGGSTVFDLKVRCPSGTVPEAAGCMEESLRPPTAFQNAFAVCGNAARRLPTYAERAEAARTGVVTSPAGEWTSSVYRNPANGSDRSDQLEVVVVTADPESVTYKQAFTPEQLPYRCVASPSN